MLMYTARKSAAYLKDFKGYVHSDGYSGYNKLDGIIRCGCRAHLRRKFVDAIAQKREEKTDCSRIRPRD